VTGDFLYASALFLRLHITKSPLELRGLSVSKQLHAPKAGGDLSRPKCDVRRVEVFVVLFVATNAEFLKVGRNVGSSLGKPKVAVRAGAPDLCHLDYKVAILLHLVPLPKGLFITNSWQRCVPSSMSDGIDNLRGASAGSLKLAGRSITICALLSAFALDP
jgi:hypothetical protein